MLRRLFLIAVMATLAGCAEPGGLATQTAATTLDRTIFTAPTNVQALTFTSGGDRDPRPLALLNFLYGKRWLSCRATASTTSASKAMCTFETAGRAYARANGWSEMRSSGACVQCETWSVPVATAKLQRVASVTAASQMEAIATYAYSVVPTEFGTQLADYMARNPAAWCGPIPNVAGGWFAPRNGTAAFARVGAGWQLARPAVGFASTFGDPAVTAATTERPCSPAPILPAPRRTPAASASTEPRLKDHAYTLVGAPWSCESVNGEPSTQRYVLESDGSITLHDDVRVANHSYDIVATYRFDPAYSLWRTAVRGGGYAGTAAPWSHEKWTFTGIETERGRRSLVRMIYTQLGDQAYRRDFQLSTNGQTFVSETCKRT